MKKDPKVSRPASRLPGPVSGLLLVLVLYVFFLSIRLIGEGCEFLGRGYAERIIRETASPLLGFVVGLLATSIVQSSSAVTSVIVAMCSTGHLTIRAAIPIIMGSNIGTTVTCTVVALGHISRRADFRRAMASATVHDFFNVLTAAILLPLELWTHFLERTASWLAWNCTGTRGVEFASPVKTALAPAVTAIEYVLRGIPTYPRSVVMLVLGLITLFVSIGAFVKVASAAFGGKMEVFFDRYITRRPFYALMTGLVFTALIQSSSATTSILVPMSAAGIFTLEQVYPIALGANIGTTVTAILAALAGNVLGLTAAFSHTLFNVTGVLMWFPVALMRRVPMWCARAVAALTARYRPLAFVYVGTVFYLLPVLVILLSRFVLRR